MAVVPCEGVLNMKWTWHGAKELESALQRKSETDFKKVVAKNLLEMRNRAVKSSRPSSGGTPVDTAELRLSAGVDLNRETMGYTKDYAPHVEFGYRQQVGRYVPAIKKRLVKPYVPGQYFLKTNFNIQKPIYVKDLERKLKE